MQTRNDGHILKLEVGGPLIIWEYCREEPPMHHPVVLSQVTRGSSLKVRYCATVESVKEAMEKLRL